MKTRIKLTVTMFTLILAVASCKKETTDETGNSTASVAALTQQANSDFLAVNIAGGTETEAFSVPGEGIPDAYAMNDSCMKDDIDKRPEDRGKRFHDHVKLCKLSDDQKEQVKTALHDFVECRKPNLETFREAMKEALTTYDNSRIELIARFKDSSITVEIFHEQMKVLHDDLAANMKSLKEAQAPAIKACYETFLNKVKEILGDDFGKFAGRFRHN